METLNEKDNDFLTFLDDDDSSDSDIINPWKLLIVDDDEEIHNITSIVLSGFTYDSRSLIFLHAYSGNEAEQIVKNNPDIAVILLDVVMETEDSGLKVVKHIRNKLMNKYVRIILRTGQPGQAPEQHVIENYDINDYKEKTELTAQKLVTSIVASLRTYESMQTIVKLNAELEQKVLMRTAELQESLEVIKRDEEAGRKIQFKLLPDREKKIAQYSFSHRIIPSLYLSGDFLDYFRINEKLIGFYIADVSGHGASSAFVTVLLKGYMNNMLEKYRTEKNNMICKPDKLVKAINKLLLSEDIEKHLTLFYGVIDTTKNSLTFSNGGQYPFPFLCDHENIEMLEYKGFPVGLLDFAEFDLHEIILPGVFDLTFFSDGVLEIIDNEGDCLSSVLVELVKKTRGDIDSMVKITKAEKLKNIPDDLTFFTISKGK